MRSVLRIAFVFLIQFLILRSIVHESNAPFIYYYSRGESAFFIESAYGPGRRILASYKLPPNHFDILGPGWSPSGRWFAWYSNKYTGDYEMVNAVHIVSRGGSKTKTFGSLGRIVNVVWSPVEDLLYFEEEGGYGPTKAFIYDSRQDITTELKNPQASSVSLQLSWSPDGNYIMRPYIHEGETHLQVFSSSANIIMDKRIYIAGNENASWDVYTPYQCILPRWTPDSDLMYMSGTDDLIIEDLATGDQQHLFSGGNLGWVDWSPDGNYALIFPVQHCYNPQLDITGIWLLSRLNDTMTYLGDISGFPAVLPLYPEFYSGISPEFWTSDSQRFAYVDRPGNIMISEVPALETEVVFPTPDESFPSYNNLALFWTTDEDLEWFDYEARVWNRYNIDSGMETMQLDEASSGYYFQYSPDQAYVAFYNTNCGHTCIVAMEEEPQIIMQLGSPDNTSPPAIYYWHASSDWLIIVTERSGVLMADIENRTYRKIPVSGFNYIPSQFGWLPDVVD